MVGNGGAGAEAEEGGEERAARRRHRAEAGRGGADGQNPRVAQAVDVVGLGWGGMDAVVEAATAARRGWRASATLTVAAQWALAYISW